MRDRFTRFAQPEEEHDRGVDVLALYQQLYVNLVQIPAEGESYDERKGTSRVFAW
jgi:hypothetical protein